jgi:hypothetical protein
MEIKQIELFSAEMTDKIQTVNDEFYKQFTTERK